MNYVAHLFLSKPTDEHRIGNLLADFTVGTLASLETRYSAEITAGIAHHRAVDRFTDRHPQVERATEALSTRFGLYSGIIVDVVFDHFLLRYWHDYTATDEAAFFESVYRSLARMDFDYPDRYVKAVTGIVEKRWLPSYRDLDSVAYALKRIGMRFSTATPLDDTREGILESYSVLSEAFKAFFPELIQYSNSISGYPICTDSDTLLLEK